MAYSRYKAVNFGAGKAGLATIGYTLKDSSGVTSGSRVTAGVVEVPANSGIYGAVVTIPDGFIGSIVWDINNAAPYASEDINPGIDERTDAAISTRSTYAGGAVASVTGAVGSVTGNVGGNVVGSVGSLTGYTAPPTVGAIADAVWDEALAGHVTAGSAGAGLTSAVSAADPLENLVPGDYDPGTAGYMIGVKMALLGAAQVTVYSPMFGGGSQGFRIRQGTAYTSTDGSEPIEWTESTGAWLDYVGMTGEFTARRGSSTLTADVEFTLVGGDVVKATLELLSTDTSNLEHGKWTFDVMVPLVPVTEEVPPIIGVMMVRPRWPSSVS